MNVIFQINGGIGKCVLATSLLPAIKEKYPNGSLIVVSGYADVFLNNPHVDRSFQFGQFQYFYQDYIDNKDFIFLGHDPYLTEGHIRQDEHLSLCWAKLCNLTLTENVTPKLYISNTEYNLYKQKFQSDKPILLMQPNGGVQSDLKYSWARDIPANVVKAVIEEFKDKYNIVHLKREDQTSFEFTTPVSDVFRSIAVLIDLSNKRLFMDSFAQHTAAALNKPSTVLWIANKPEVFGYELHNNIKANKFTKKPDLKNSYIAKFNIAGDPVEFPYNDESEIFMIDEIIKSLK
jgi:ADP-heptose:LPS heptosyltransferase